MALDSRKRRVALRFIRHWRDSTMPVNILAPFHPASQLSVVLDKPLPALLAGRLESSIEFYDLSGRPVTNIECSVPIQASFFETHFKSCVVSVFGGWSVDVSSLLPLSPSGLKRAAG